MKKIFCLLLLLILICGVCSGCKRQRTAEEIWDSLYDHEEVAELASQIDGSLYKSMQASERGDTYCRKCDKVNPGRVRICTYCGQYI